MTPQGWYEAWARFTEVEAASRISVADHAPSRPATTSHTVTVAAVLLAAGVVCGVIGLFPAYLGGASLASQADQLVPHALYLALWATAAGLLLRGGLAARAGALLAVAASATTFGFYFSDAGTAISAGSHVMGAGLVLALVGWLICAFASGQAVISQFSGWRPSRAIRPRGPAIGVVIASLVTAVGVAISFAPSWDSYTLQTATGQTQTITAGNAFANPAPVIAGDVAVMVVLVAIAVVAALWRPVVLGATLLVGAIVPMAAQAVSALIQLGQPTSPAQFGISSSQAAQVQLRITAGFTPAFYIYCGFLAALVLLCARLFLSATPKATERAIGPTLS
ncbi:MAG: hypothetical protein JWO62_120 [Acidimicrobiaceae bacterium]|nr:hypothetical protein [Acidimicrobiaceae bacterium]